MKKALIFCVKLLVTFGLFVLLFRPETFSITIGGQVYGLKPDTFGGVKPMDMLREVRAAGTGNVAFWLAFATAVKLAGMLAGVLRWRILLQGQGLNIPFWYMVQSWFVGRTIGIFLPGTIGLDGYRLYDSSVYTGDVVKCFTVIAIEKVIGFIALTSLVLLTLPLGYQLLNINVSMLAAILAFLACAIAGFFLLLLNPRVIQVIVAALPTPGPVRDKLNKLGAAVTAYSGNRGQLMLAVFFGMLVHLGTCFMYFGTMMAIKAPNTGLADVLFVSPLMIWGTVVGPTVGGEGIREIVFALVLTQKAGASASVTMAHLGWWVGELVPFLIGLPIWVLRERPDREKIEAELAEAREHAAEQEAALHLPAEAVADYRAKLINAVIAGAAGGLLAGAIIGLCEAGWLVSTLPGLAEAWAFLWGAVVYSGLFLPVGLGVAGALVFLFLLLDRFAAPAVTFGLSLGGALGAGGLVIGLFRLKRDVLEGHALGAQDALGLLALVAGAALALALLGGGIAVVGRRRGAGRLGAIAGAAAAYALLLAVGLGLSLANRSSQAAVFEPPVKAQGPNLILLGIDALRADYLSFVNPDAPAQTPVLDALLEDSVHFPRCFAQSTWTKPSFATLFTGLYPEAHTATTKVSALPEDAVTLAETLRDGGYYTKGFSNNPNIMAIFQFNQGFVDYTDLKPRLLFGATASAAKLSMYEVLRKGRQKILGKISNKLDVRDFYQPAEDVTRHALAWLDSGAPPEDAPFFLFLHYMDPHDPFMDAGRPGVGYARARIEHPDPALRDPMIKAYNDEITYMDRHLGALFDGLKQRGLYDDAVILFTSDHGEEFYDHEGWWHGQTLFDELMHVPLIVKLPGNARGGQSNAALTRHVDVPATLIGLAGLTPPQAMRGRPLFDAQGAPAPGKTEYVYAEVDFEGNVLQAVRTKDAKIIHANEDNKRGLAPVEFYDLEADPAELDNVAGRDHARKTEQDALDKVLEKMREAAKSNAVEPSIGAGMSQDVKDQLESLGYLGDE